MKCLDNRSSGLIQSGTVVEILVIGLVCWLAYTVTARSKKRRGEIVGPDGKKYELWDKDWESEPRVGDNCNADLEPFYRGPDGKPYIKGKDGKFW
jgi:hypothetical protein